MDNFQRTLRLQSPYLRGEDVRELQTKIGATPDGIFGPKTNRMVKIAQHLVGIEATGVVDQTTWNAIKNRLENRNGQLILRSASNGLSTLQKAGLIAAPIVAGLIAYVLRSGRKQ